jgi:hypothetical protein
VVLCSVVWILVRVLRLLLLRISSPDNSAKKRDMKHETRGSVDSRRLLAGFFGRSVSADPRTENREALPLAPESASRAGCFCYSDTSFSYLWPAASIWPGDEPL